MIYLYQHKKTKKVYECSDYDDYDDNDCQSLKYFDATQWVYTMCSLPDDEEYHHVKDLSEYNKITIICKLKKTKRKRRRRKKKK